MEPSTFDELTKALTTATSRRQALRSIAGILGGTALAGLFPGLALAKNKTCAQFCASVFGDNTPAAEQCATDATHGTGLCYTCGPSSPGGTKPICCPQNPDGTCTSYSSATCCASGQVCQKGQCVTPCTANGGTCSQGSDCCSGNCSNGFCCASGRVGLSNGTCAMPCDPYSSTYCCGSNSCYFTDISGPYFCLSGPGDGPCGSDLDCPYGMFCDEFGFCWTAAVC